MPNPVKPKTNLTAGLTPQPANLVIGEIATNAADGFLFMKKTDNSITRVPVLPVFPAGAIVGTTDIQTLTNKTINGGVITRLVETSNLVTATATSLTVDLANTSIFTTSTLSGTTTLTINNVAAQLVANNQTFTLTVISAQSATTAFINSILIAGATTTTVRWQNGTAPTAGSASPASDLYSITILRTGTGVYTVYASRTPF